MDVNKTDAVLPVGQGSPKKDKKHGAQNEKQEDPNTDDGESPWEGTEAFAMDGVLADDLGPEIQKTLEGLAGQIEPLRVEVERLKGREAHFKDLAEKPSFLPVPGRREFLRELTHVLNNMANVTPSPSLAVLHLVNADDIRRRWGRSALDAVLIHVCAVMDSNLHPTDVAGSIGGNDFGIILLAGDQELARTKTTALVDAIGAKAFLWRDQSETLEVVAGVGTLEDAKTAENALAAADRDLMDGLERPAGNQAMMSGRSRFST